jgi:hypothetical protein
VVGRLDEMTDRELQSRRAQLAVEVRTDPDRREDLREVEEEIARRREREGGAMVASTHDVDVSEPTEEELRGLTASELEARRVALLHFDGDGADARGRQEVLAEIRRREAGARSAAELDVPDAERTVRDAVEAWEAALATLRAATVELRHAIANRSDVRARAFGEPPRWARDQDAALARTQAVVSGALRPGMWSDPRATFYRTHSLGELL